MRMTDEIGSYAVCCLILAAGCTPDAPLPVSTIGPNEEKVSAAASVNEPKTPLAAIALEFAPDAAGHRDIAAPFLKKYCQRCHGGEKQESGFRVDQHLPNEFLTKAVAERWSEVLQKLNAGEMPPKKEPQPPAAEVAK